ncbi:MAG: hypothetical protein JXQ29_14275 [Planctomycetes bacterium]|nr:hypothetical protein [Planctomycetota bacterium]
MPRKGEVKDALDRLRSGEYAHVLRELLKRHRDLRQEANRIAESLIDDASVEAVAEEVTDLVSSIGCEELGGCAGRQSWGYVEPGEAAWDLLEESIEGIRADMERRFEAGMKPAAEKICQGIVVGLHDVDRTKSRGALEWAPDFPAEAAAWSLSILLQRYPQGQRRAAGNRILRGVEEHVKDWLEMMERVVSEATARKRRKRR